MEVIDFNTAKCDGVLLDVDDHMFVSQASDAQKVYSSKLGSNFEMPDFEGIVTLNGWLVKLIGEQLANPVLGKVSVAAATSIALSFPAKSGSSPVVLASPRSSCASRAWDAALQPQEACQPWARKGLHALRVQCRSWPGLPATRT